MITLFLPLMAQAVQPVIVSGAPAAPRSGEFRCNLEDEQGNIVVMAGSLGKTEPDKDKKSYLALNVTEGFFPKTMTESERPFAGVFTGWLEDDAGEFKNSGPPGLFITLTFKTHWTQMDQVLAPGAMIVELFESGRNRYAYLQGPCKFSFSARPGPVFK